MLISRRWPFPFERPAFDRVVSLGHFCVTRHQVERHLRHHSCRPPETFVFDWQTTLPEALLAYFRADFRGLFELEELVIGEDKNVHHVRLGTIHPHEFGEPNSMTSRDELIARYPGARQRHDYLAGKFRDLLSLRGERVLYVLSTFPSEPETDELLGHLARDPGHDFQLLMIAANAAAAPRKRERLTASVIDPHIPGPDYRVWEGNDGEWERVLSRYRFAV